MPKNPLFFDKINKMNKPKLYIPVGIQGSGKSTRGEQLQKQGVVVVSSDKTREELFGQYATEEIPLSKILQDQYCDAFLQSLNIKDLDSKSIKEKIRLCNNEVFKELDKKVNLLLANNKDIYYDGTNISKKVRRNIIEKYKDRAEIICEYFTTPLKICLERNKNRDRKVSEEAIINYSKWIQTPELSEGFDKLCTINTRGEREEVEKQPTGGRFE